jgi:hypothetical protein
MFAFAAALAVSPARRAFLRRCMLRHTRAYTRRLVAYLANADIDKPDKSKAPDALSVTGDGARLNPATHKHSHPHTPRPL